MEYFKQFPKVEFNGKDITNICARLDLVKQVKNNAALFDLVQVHGEERPEDIALMAYGNADLFWLILWVNDIVDPYFEWVMTDTQLLVYIQDVYGTGNEYDTHHYETTSDSSLGAGIWVNSGTPFSTAISNFSYEETLNEQRRKIKVLNPNFVSRLLTEYKAAL